MTAPAAEIPHAPLRPPQQVMRLARMGAFFPTRLSFMRSLIRKLHDEDARVTRPVWDIDARGYGRAVYSVSLGGHVYSLVAFSSALAPDQRTDRVIAEAWDTTYVLFDGTPELHDLDRLDRNAPRQEAGRFLDTELVLARANKSVRLFEHVAGRLAEGRQPDRELIGRIGYLMRTTAVYGNGKFGIADRAGIAGRPGIAAPFRVEMLTVWLIRGFTLDLVEHVARSRNLEAAVPLAPSLRRYLGIGNATGLGMAPFLVSHPVLLNNWMVARETGLARIRAIGHAPPASIEHFLAILARARRHVAEWNVEDERQMRRILTLREELAALAVLATTGWLAQPDPWERLIGASTDRSPECQEMILAMVMEPHGALIDDLTDQMTSAHEARLEPAMPTSALAKLVDGQFGWAREMDLADPAARRLFWYVSEEKLEPRLGERETEPGAEKELPLDIARQVQTLAAVLGEGSPDETVAELVMRRPDLRHVVRRVQTAAHYPYSEIRDNLIGAGCLPVDMLRCKLSFFGASKFDPKSDRWTRITMYQGAPGFEDIGRPDADDWAFPVLAEAP